MTAHHDGTMAWPKFTSRERLRDDLRSIVDAKTEADAYGLLMGVAIGAYVLVERQREPGMDVREAAKRAMDGM